MKRKLAIFDFDSTLIDGETLEILAKTLKLKMDTENITARAMNGELDFYASLTSRVLALKGVKYCDAIEIFHTLPFMNGAFECIKELKKMNYLVFCFSGGFLNATEIAKEKLKLDATFANTLRVVNGVFTGEIGGEMMFADSKGVMLKKLQDILKISIEDTIAVGDGANDASMFAFADKKIAFCAKPFLKERANIIIDDKNLENILNHIRS